MIVDLRVVLVDDHPMFRQGLRTLLEDLGVTVLAEAADGESGVAAVVEHRPDVVFMDLQMPGVSGVEATKRLTDLQPEVKVLVLTMVEDDQAVFAAIQAGALGYLLKGAGQEEISRALASVAAGQARVRRRDRPPPPGVLRRRRRHVRAALPVAVGAGAGGAGAHRRGRVQHRHRPSPVPVGQDGPQLRVEHLRQDRRRRSPRGDRQGPRGGAGSLTLSLLRSRSTGDRCPCPPGRRDAEAGSRSANGRGQPRQEHLA